MSIQTMVQESIGKLSLAERNLLLTGMNIDNLSPYDAKIAYMLQKKHLIKISDGYRGNRIIVYTMKGRIVRDALLKAKEAII